MKRILYLILWVVVLPLSIEAQDRGVDRLKLPKTPRRYYTQKNHQRLLSLDKEMRIKRNFLERDIAALSYNDLPKEVNIPVIVHVLYKTGTDKKLLPTESDIRQQLDICTKDFRQRIKIEKHEADTKERFSEKSALDTKVSFCLASQTPTGQKTTGVLMVPTSVTTWLADDKMKSANTGGSTPWNTEKYLNIWVVNFPDTISGYAQMPAGPTATDGIVIDMRYFGKKSNKDKTFPYTEGKTLTHLIGSYLNVYELWSETELCGDDFVEDTPIHNAPTLGCVDYRHVSTCGSNPVAMTMNFMDNTNDDCQYMFTKGQMRRMWACLVKEGIRYSLVQSGDIQCGQNKANLLSSLKLELDATAEVEKARITWVNNTGALNDYFDIQKLNLRTGDYESISKVNSHYIDGLENYTSYDNQPIDGDNTYRIKLVMTDGTERLSEPKTVSFYNTAGIHLYPNPTEDVLNITLKGYMGQDVDIQIFDMQGKHLLTRHIDKLQSDVQTLVIGDKIGIGQYLVLIQSKGKRDVVRQFTVGK